MCKKNNQPANITIIEIKNSKHWSELIEIYKLEINSPMPKFLLITKDGNISTIE